MDLDEYGLTYDLTKIDQLQANKRKKNGIKILARGDRRDENMNRAGE